MGNNLEIINQPNTAKYFLSQQADSDDKGMDFCSRGLALVTIRIKHYVIIFIRLS